MVTGTSVIGLESEGGEWNFFFGGLFICFYSFSKNNFSHLFYFEGFFWGVGGWEGSVVHSSSLHGDLDFVSIFLDKLMSIN